MATVVSLVEFAFVTAVVTVFIVPLRSPKNVGEVTVPAKVASPELSIVNLAVLLLFTAKRLGLRTTQYGES